MNTLYICGDSYAVPDPVYGKCWVELLADQIKTKFNVINLARVCASNLQISSQVDRAIQNKADFIICLFTTSTRDDVQHRKVNKKEFAQRYTNIANDTNDTDLTSYSVFSLDNTTVMSDLQLSILRQYHAEFFDLNLTVYKNEILIEGILSRLKNSGIPFVYDQGGFENAKFVDTKDKIYFTDYLEYKSPVNLWNFTHSKKHRPYYHIEDLSIHKNVADYYSKLINEQT